MEASEHPSKWSLLYYVPFWILWGCVLFYPYWGRWTASDAAAQLALVLVKAMLVALVFSFIPVVARIDEFRIWVRRALFLPVALGLLGLILLLPFIFVAYEISRAFRP